MPVWENTDAAKQLKEPPIDAAVFAVRRWFFYISDNDLMDANFLLFTGFAKAAGMKYVVLTAKHHDGFAMYDSKCSDYNVVKMCPSHRDVARELADEVRKAGLKMCFYYSQALDWEDPDAFENTWDFREERKVYRRFLDGKCKTQLKELLTEYGEIGLIWFDMPGGMSVEESLELKAYVKQFKPDCLVSGRVNMDQTIGDYGSMGDNEFPSGKLPGNWETPATLNNNWGYRPSDHNWKTPEELLRLFIELLSKGMNYLLNIGPMPDGAIPPESVELLSQMGRRIAVNEEAVYGTQATPYAFDFSWGRISQKENILYLYLFEHEESLEIPGLENRVRHVSLLTESGRQELVWERRETEYGTVLSIERPRHAHFYYDVVRVELDGVPCVKQGLYQLPDGGLNLYSHMSVLDRETEPASAGEEEVGTGVAAVNTNSTEVDAAAEKNNLLVKDNCCIDSNGNIIHWFNPEYFASWEFELYRPGEYEIYVQTRSAKYTPWVGGHLVAVRFEGQIVQSRLSEGEKVQNAHTRYFDERLTKLGVLQVGAGGIKSISLHLLECDPAEQAGLSVTKLMLKKVNW